MIGRKDFAILITVSILSFLFGILVNYLSSSTGSTQEDVRFGGFQLPDEDVRKKLIAGLNASRIKDNFKYLTDQPHIAGGQRDNELARFIRDKFTEASFDSSQLVPYDLLLSYPNSSNPNKIYLHSGVDKIFESSHIEVPIHDRDGHSNFIHAFNAYSSAGTVRTSPGTGVIYVNFGRVEDFEFLSGLGVNVSGHVVIARYGKIFRGNKVRNAEESGAIGIILFSDPAEVAAEGTSPSDVYDNTLWVPGSGMQRGSVYLEGDGDPLTPGWPSTEHSYRIPVGEARLSIIPCQPIGYSDAAEILGLLDGQVAPKDWQGKIPNLTYRLGPLFKPAYANVSLTLSTHNYEKIVRNYNVIGIIRGSLEPDRFVIAGNHRDAWGYGSVDPSSGTAQLLETVALFGTLLREGWRPRRSIVFCSWAAEEYSLTGSVEWVEEHIDKLRSKAVAYINNDLCSGGPILHIDGSPLLRHVAVNITKMIPGVDDPSKTLFEEWKENQRDIEKKEIDVPSVGLHGSGSDHAPFAFHAGVPILDFWFDIDPREHDISIYPSYHTGYETFHMVDKFMDPQYKFMKTCGLLSTLLLHQMANSPIIPYSIEEYPVQMKQSLKNLKSLDKLKSIYDKFDELENSIDRFYNATMEFQKSLSQRKLLSFLEERMINDQLMQIEGSFLFPAGLPDRPSNIRHAIFAPSQFDDYASAGFPGLADLLHDYDSLDGDALTERRKQVRRHASELTIMTDRATSVLKDLHLF